MRHDTTWKMTWWRENGWVTRRGGGGVYGARGGTNVGTGLWIRGVWRRRVCKRRLFSARGVGTGGWRKGMSEGASVGKASTQVVKYERRDMDRRRGAGVRYSGWGDVWE